MSDIDRKILEAIKAETDVTMKGYERELGFFGLIAESFKGRFGWLVIGAIVMQVVLAAALIYCAVRFYGTGNPATKLDWLAPGIAAFIAFGLLRIWYFMEINRLSITREIKRVELQLAAIASALRSSGNPAAAR
jgi:Family of unknown function (DUF6768)